MTLLEKTERGFVARMMKMSVRAGMMETPQINAIRA